MSSADGAAQRLEQRRDDRREAIVDRALSLVATEGIDRLTLQRVAASLGYVPAALYRYFGSRDGLVAAMQRRAVEELGKALGRTIEEAEARASRTSSETAALTGLLSVARFYLFTPITHPEAFGLVSLLVGDPRHLVSESSAHRSAPAFLSIVASVQALFEGAVTAGALSPGETLPRALSLWAALQGGFSIDKALRIAPVLPSSSALGQATARTLLLGWGARPEAVKRAEALAAEVVPAPEAPRPAFPSLDPTADAAVTPLDKKKRRA